MNVVWAAKSMKHTTSFQTCPRKRNGGCQGKSPANDPYPVSQNIAQWNDDFRYVCAIHYITRYNITQSTVRL